MTREKHKYDEFSEMVTNIIEVLGEERLLEHLIENMTADDRRDLGAELNDKLILNLNEENNRHAVVESVVGSLKEWKNNYHATDFEKFKLTLIWAIAEAGLDG